MADKQKPAPQSGVKPRKIPMRQCLGCNEHRPKAELLRVLRKARKSRRLERTLACVIPDEVYDRMEAEIPGSPPPAGTNHAG